MQSWQTEINKNFQEVQTRLRSAIFQTKLKQKHTMENMFNSNGTRQAWSCLKTIAEIKTAHTSFEPKNKSEFPNELNSLSARYDTQDFQKE